tara:strand:+ start:14587 stop:16086 length:1500 start_codon:yes stop_codon:yes gene_type:complete
MIKRTHIIVLVGLLLIGHFGFSQKVLLPFDRVTSQDAMRQLYESDSIIHLSFKPLLLDKSGYDTLISRTNSRFTQKKYNSWASRKLFRENLAVLKAEDFYMSIDVVMNLEGGKDLSNTTGKTLSTNTRGVLIQGNITDKIYFRTDFYETQSYFPTYMDSMIASSGVVPGQGKAKSFKTGGYDYPMVTGIVNFQATKNVNVQFGQDKMFIGNGYRSLLLSDNAAPFLFLQAGVNLFENKLNYHTNWASLQTLNKVHGPSGGDDLFAKKQANFNYLSFKPNAKFEVGLFEGVMWERWNEYTGSQNFDPVFLNPVPFLTTAIKSNDTLVNSLIGFNLFYKPLIHTAFYGQFTHGVQGGGSGFQMGTKLFDVLGVEGLNFQLEYNHVGEGVYGTKNNYTDYFQFNQPLAVQQMENFSEVIFIGNYRFKRVLVHFKAALANVNNDAIGTASINNYDANVGYLFNPITNLMVNMGVRYRDHSITGNTNWVYFGVKTNLRNLYYDF